MHFLSAVALKERKRAKEGHIKRIYPAKTIGFQDDANDRTTAGKVMHRVLP